MSPNEAAPDPRDSPETEVLTVTRVPTGNRREPLWRHLVGEQLRALRKSRGETLGAVAGRARVSPQYLSELERGSKEASSEILAAIGEALDSSLLDLTSAVAGRLTELGTAASAPRRTEVALAA